MRGRFSIRYKFLAVTTLLLMVCVTAYLLLATTVFKTDKTELVFDYNRSLVTNIASEMDSFFQGVADKMKLIAFFSRRPAVEREAFMQDIMLNNPDMVFVAESTRFEKLNQVYYKNSEYIETYALKADFFEAELLQQRAIPFDLILKEGQAIWNATTENGAPLLGYGRSIMEETASGVPLRQYAMVAFIRSDKLLRSLHQGNLNEVFIATGKGEILAHLDKKLLLKPDAEQAFVKKILSQKLRTSVLETQKDGKNILGAFSKAFNDQVIVVSQVSEEKAFAVVHQFLYRSLLFAMMVLTVAFMAAILFSRSLTKPLEALMNGMKNVAQGDLTTSIQVKSRDELQVLAGSFNEMIKDLKQSREELEEVNRGLEDKVKDRTRQLEKQNQAVKNAQEALLRTTRLAAVGEIAGRAAHEVLNPLTSILSRVELMKNRILAQKSESSAVIKEILQAWEEDYSQGGWDKLLESWKAPSGILPGKSLFDEDLENMKTFETQNVQKADQLQNDTEFLLKEGLRINRIVQSMRGLSVVKSDKQLYNLYELLEEGTQIMADWVSQYDTEMELKVFDKNLQVELDRDEFLQALTNLLRNSAQAIQSKKTHESGPKFKGKIWLSVEVHEAHLNILIQDNGSGISKENQDKLFKGQFTTKSRDEGTGLGLNISRRFIRAFGGDINLKKSSETEGTCFVLSLPRALNQKKASGEEPDNERESA